MTTETGLSWDAPAAPGSHWIEIELDHPVNPWEHEGAGSIIWGAHLDRSAPLGEEAVSVIKQAWEQRETTPHDRAERQEEKPDPVASLSAAPTSIKPGWASPIEVDEYWIYLTLHQPINERWFVESGDDWSHGELINDGILKRGVTIEATTRLGRRALRIIEALHRAHPYNELDPPESETS